MAPGWEFPHPNSSPEEDFHSFNHPFSFTHDQHLPKTDHPPPPPPPPGRQMQLQLKKDSQSADSGLERTIRISRKNQGRRINNVIRRMTQEEILAADSWTWRKYGQKPIKGSPNPRNYYRCTSSKGCGGRKHVEKSIEDPNIYIVTYSGEHTHLRHTHRTRDHYKFRPNPIAMRPSVLITPPMIVKQAIEVEDRVDDAGGYNSEEEEEIVFIPNTIINEDILLSFQQLGRLNTSSFNPLH